MKIGKKIISATLSLILACSACGVGLCSNMTSMAATNTTISIPADSIPVKVKSFGADTIVGSSFNMSTWKAVDLNNSDGDYYWENKGSAKYRYMINHAYSIKSTTDSSVELLNRYNVSFQIELGRTNITADEVKSLLTLTVVSKNAGRPDGSGVLYNNPVVSGSNGKFQVKFNIISYGEKISYKLGFTRTNNSSIKITSGSLSTANVNYYMVTTEYNGENIQAIVPNKIHAATARTWAKRTCQMVNSLSDVTGMKKETVYIVFNDPATSCPQCHNAVISNDYYSPTVRLTTSSSNAVVNAAKKGNMDWGEMHEISHAYSFKGLVTDKSGNAERKFVDNYCHNLDDIHTNVRALTAMQNCNQLRNIKVYIENNTAKGGTYLTAMNVLTNPSNGVAKDESLFILADKYVDFAIKYGWDNLETFFKATGDVTLSASDINTAAKFAEKWSVSGKVFGEDWSFASIESYKCINSFSKLAQLEGMKFDAFLNDCIGGSVFVDCYTALLNEKDSAKLGDVNLDGKINSTDSLMLNKSTIGLVEFSPKSALNADVNGDGYVNILDVTALNKKIGF